jgi:signal recognition particle GTPase
MKYLGMETESHAWEIPFALISERTIQEAIELLFLYSKPYVLMVVGVNGGVEVGKTTTVKLAYQFKTRL